MKKKIDLDALRRMDFDKISEEELDNIRKALEEELEENKKELERLERTEKIFDKVMHGFMIFGIIAVIALFTYGILMETGVIKDTCPKCGVVQASKNIKTYNDRENNEIRLCDSCLMEGIYKGKQADGASNESSQSEGQ